MIAYADFSAIPRHAYSAILCDPPWSFKAWSAKGAGRSAEQHFRTLTFDELAAFPVAELAADRCALFMWVVRSNLPEAMHLIDAWGFKYKSTAFVWEKTCRCQPDKPRISQGYWTRGGTEQCWFATRGKKNPPRKSKGVRELIIAPIGRHSEKPAETCNRIEALVDGPYLELFARQTRPGWDAWGDDPALTVWDRMWSRPYSFPMNKEIPGASAS